LEEADPKIVAAINAMPQQDMARLWRFAPAGHPYFDTNLPYFKIFQARFKGFTPSISKSLGWGPDET
jgi:hypothetical protein